MYNVTKHHLFAWFAHLFTASGLIIIFLSLLAVIQKQYLLFFQLNFLAILIDSADGLIARKANVKKYAAQIDGALMDNIIDFITYALAPALFIALSSFVPNYAKFISIIAILIASIFQFSNNNAKTPDHFFLGFPDYWNLLIFYLFVWHTSPTTNFITILICTILSFVPIKFVYPSRIDYLSSSKLFKQFFTLATILWGFATSILLMSYPHIPHIANTYILLYSCFYTLTSLYKTFITKSNNL